MSDDDTPSNADSEAEVPEFLQSEITDVDVTDLSKYDYDTVIVSHEDIKEHPRNYRSHPDDQISHIKESLADVGFYKNILLSQDGYILAGHGVTQATASIEGELDSRLDELQAENEGNENKSLINRIKLPQNGLLPAVIIPYDHDEPEALKRLTGDNELRNIGEQNDKMLTELLDDIRDSGADLLGTAFDDQRMNDLKMLDQSDEEENGLDHEEHWTGMPESDGEGQRSKLSINFRSPEDREAFLESTDLDVESDSNKKTLSTWHPEEPDADIDPDQQSP